MSEPGPTWPDEIFHALLEADVRQVGYVPDSGHARLIEMCRAEPGMAAVPLTSEEEGVALVAGAWLGGQRGALLMQSSGVGNCVNMLALTRTCRFPLLMLVTMRGQSGETNPWQLPMGQIAGDVLRLSGVIVHGVEAAEDAGETVAAAARTAFDAQAAAAVLIAQHVIGVKTFDR